MHRDTTQLYSSTNNNNNILNETQLSEDYVRNPNNYLIRNRSDSYDHAKVNNVFIQSFTNNFQRNDNLSIISSLSSKEDEIVSEINFKTQENKKMKDLIYYKANLSHKIVESDSSSASSLDSFELDFEDVICF